MKVEQLDLLVVALGPGSFTGLRLGVVAGKTIGYSSKCPIKGVNIFEVLACQAMSSAQNAGAKRLSIGMNIGRGDVLVASFDLQGQIPKGSGQPTIQKPEQWIESLDEFTAISGSGVGMLEQNHKARAKFVVADDLWEAKVEAVAKLGIAEFNENGADDVWSLAPIYSRPSAAEEAWNQYQ